MSDATRKSPMKRLLIPAAIVAALAFAGTASAHTPTVTPSCTGLVVNLVSYEGTAQNNQITVQVDSHTTITTFGGSYSHTFAWSTTSGHTWAVQIDANRLTGNPTLYDRTFTGNWQACEVAPTTTIAPTTTSSTPVSTTIAPTTTTLPPTTTTTDAPASTEGRTTTTSVVAVDTPPVPSTTVVPPTTPPTTAVIILPRTGIGAANTAAVALTILSLGILAAAVRRRPRRT